MGERIKLALVYGSTRQGRFCDVVVAWAAGEIARHPGFAISLIDPADVFERSEQRGAVALAELHARLDDADAFVVVTPEYNHSYSSSLKFLLECAGEPWHAKPVAFVSYGGISGGLRAIEHLRLVFADLHAVTMRDTVSFSSPWNRVAPDGTLPSTDATERAMTKMLTKLLWWAKVLRQARRSTPYDDVMPMNEAVA